MLKELPTIHDIETFSNLQHITCNILTDRCTARTMLNTKMLKEVPIIYDVETFSELLTI